jgi:uncharacterized membrane protein YqjE
MAAVPEFSSARRPGPGLGALVGSVFSEGKALLSDYATLAVLDARRAAIRLAWMLGSGLMIAILVVTAWMAGVAAGIVWMADEGVSWPAAISIAAFINLVAAGGLVYWMRSLVSEMPFTALLRQLRGDRPQPAASTTPPPG